MLPLALPLKLPRPNLKKSMLLLLVGLVEPSSASDPSGDATLEDSLEGLEVLPSVIKSLPRLRRLKILLTMLSAPKSLEKSLMNSCDLSSHMFRVCRRSFLNTEISFLSSSFVPCQFCRMEARMSWADFLSLTSCSYKRRQSPIVRTWLNKCVNFAPSICVKRPVQGQLSRQLYDLP